MFFLFYRQKIVLLVINSSNLKYSIEQLNFRTKQTPFQNCDKKYTQKGKLNQHLLKDHDIDNRSLSVKCSFCSNLFKNRRKLIFYLNQSHAMKIKIINVEFDSLEQFQESKENEQSINICQYVKRRGTNKKKADFYECNRSGSRRIKEEERKRDYSTKGSSKIDCLCTSFMEASQVEGNLDFISIQFD